MSAPRASGRGGRTPLEKGLAVLQALAAADDALSAGEVAERCGFNRTTAYRLCESLERVGWIQPSRAEGTGRGRRFNLGAQALGLAVLALSKHDPEARLQPIMDGLAETVNETVHCGVLDGASLIHVGKALPDDGLQVAMRLGAVEPAHVTALGKAILSTMSRDAVLHRYPEQELPVRTPRTIPTRDALLEDLARTLERGYAVDDEESGAGIKCIGVPVFGAGGAAIFAFSVTSIPSHLDGERADAVAHAVRAAAAQATAAFGGTVPAPWSASADSASGRQRQPA